MMATDVPATSSRRPRVALTLGDSAGIDLDLAAKLLSNPENFSKADVFILAGKDVIEAAIIAAGGVKMPITEIASVNRVQIMDEGPGTSKSVISLAQISKEAVVHSTRQLRQTLGTVLEGQVDTIVFVPLNKSSPKLVDM
ncbi:hypothetical protein F4775DRAFT_277211 [Biscogniauxia sp. FL1348]|nr:hypothetical protein F4775DRAFT_277211 [Biscogniauxia sp. FL1348]